MAEVTCTSQMTVCAWKPFADSVLKSRKLLHLVTHCKLVLSLDIYGRLGTSFGMFGLGFFPLPFLVATTLRGTKATISLEGKLENLYTARSPSFLGVLCRNIISFHTEAIAEDKRNTPLKMLIVYLNCCAISFNRL